MSKDAYKAEKERIKALYKMDTERCKGLSGNARDICRAEASGREKIALADLDARNENTPKAREDAMTARADAIYSIDMQKCDDLAGQKKDLCRQEAKSMRDKVRADAKAGRQSESAQMTANEKLRTRARKPATPSAMPTTGSRWNAAILRRRAQGPVRQGRKSALRQVAASVSSCAFAR
jgi:hypothetical protein